MVAYTVIDAESGGPASIAAGETTSRTVIAPMENDGPGGSVFWQARLLRVRTPRRAKLRTIPRSIATGTGQGEVTRAALVLLLRRLVSQPLPTRDVGNAHRAARSVRLYHDRPPVVP